ncbi:MULTISPECIES: NAD/NADP-dependent octopine/nopaline dehydrogenase family protein [unclassified Oceanobacillus]|uniref:NAD/NADP-dependent octopine/nopaline dehydrogenase family protein n=1 Tax=unclassified Oceanobacillus TaxID=2630292 RepID=UPI0012EC5D8F|nr:NAD/NADP-dependent octopine/nopaline dehydrogenase family protein [Oceanobacillus sp. AG]
MNIAIIGAGNGGQTMAAHLTLEGHKVKLYDINENLISELNNVGGIHCDGMIKGFAPVEATTNLIETLEDAEVIMCTTNANSHSKVAESVAPYVQDGQVILIFPGYWGALEFSEVLDRAGNNKRVYVAETESLIYACRYNKPGYVTVRGVKEKLEFATYPSEDVGQVKSKLEKIYPQLLPKKSVIRTSLNNVNPIFHTPITLMNVGWIESEKDFYFYPEGASPSVVRVMEKLEAERLALGKTIGVELSSSLELLHRFYGVKENTLYEAINKNKAYQTGKAPTTLKYRYIYEDIPYGLVPISELGTALDVLTPCTDLLIDLAEIAVGEDLRESGVKLERFGLKDMTKGEIIELLNY